MTSSVRARFALVLLGVALLIAGVIAWLVVVINDLDRTARDLERLASRIGMADRVSSMLGQLLAPLNDYLLTEDVSRRDAFDRSVRQLSGVLSDAQRDPDSPEWAALAREIQEGVTRVSALALDVLFVDRPVRDPNVLRVMNTVSRLADELLAKAARFHELAENEIGIRRQHATDHAAMVMRLAIVLVVAVPLALIMVYALVARWVIAPARALSRDVAEVMAGHASRVPIRGSGDMAVVAGAINELTDRLSASHESARRRAAQWEELKASAREFGKADSRDAVYQALTDAAHALTDARYVVLAVVNDHDRIIQTIEAGSPGLGRRTSEEWEVWFAALPKSRRPLRLAAEDHGARSEALPGALPVGAVMTIPVFDEAGARSQLCVMDKRQGSFTEEDEDLLVTLIHDAVRSLRIISLREETERLATIDSLTGFVNRWAFEDRLVDEFLRAGRHGRPFALIFIDLDRLKSINEKGGHHAGDAAIRRCCDAIRSVIRTTDVAGRYGGDELLLLLPEASAKDALAVANRILRRVSSLPLTVASERVVLSASLGVAAYPEHGRDKESLIRAADFALYQAKATGGGRVHAVRPSDVDAGGLPKAA